MTVVGPAEFEATDDTANMVLMNIWRGNESYFRSWDTSGSSIGPASSSWRGSYYVADLPGSGNILTMSVFPGPGWLLQAFWRDGGSSGTADDVGYFRYIPLSSSGAIEWQNADTTWSGPMGYVGIPGTGSIQAQGDIMVGTVVYQTAWRNNEGWVRTVDVSGGTWGSILVDWNTTPIPLSTIGGTGATGDIQAMDNYVIGSTLWQHAWRNNVRWTREIPIVSGVPQWTSATTWTDTTSSVSVPNDGSHDGGNNITAAAGFIVGGSTGTTWTALPWVGDSTPGTPNTWSAARDRQAHKINNTQFYLTYSSTSSADIKSAAATAAGDYENTTTLDYSSSTSGLNIYINEYSSGSVPFAGYAIPKRGGNLCYVPVYHTPTGSCNRTGQKADYAEIQLDRAQYGSDPANFRKYVTRHEMGHVFGMYHIPCSTPTVMDTNCSSISTSSTTLQKVDKTWVNLNYP